VGVSVADVNQEDNFVCHEPMVQEFSCKRKVGSRKPAACRNQSVPTVTFPGASGLLIFSGQSV